MIYLFHGDNTFAAKQQIQKLIDRYKDSTGSDFGLHRFSEESDPDEIIQAVTSVPMFSSSSLVIIERPSQAKQLVDALLPQMERVPEETVVVIHDPDIDKRTSWFKTLQKQATVKEFTAKSRPQLLKWVHATAHAHEGALTDDAAELLLDYVGDEERQLHNEIAKLVNAAETVTPDHVQQLVRPAPRQTVFTLLDALSGGDIDAALRYFDDLRAQKVHELEMLAMLGWQLRTFLVIAAGETTPDEHLAKEHGINPFVMRKSKPIARRLPVETLESAYREIIATDYAIKTSQQEPHVLLEQLILRLHEYLRK